MWYSEVWMWLVVCLYVSWDRLRLPATLQQDERWKKRVDAADSDCIRQTSLISVCVHMLFLCFCTSAGSSYPASSLRLFILWPPYVNTGIIQGKSCDEIWNPPWCSAWSCDQLESSARKGIGDNLSFREDVPRFPSSLQGAAEVCRDKTSHWRNSNDSCCSFVDAGKHKNTLLISGRSTRLHI